MKSTFSLGIIFIFTSILNIAQFIAKPAFAIPVKHKTFADWCRQKSNLPNATRHTVEALLEEAGTKNCTQANQNLIRISNRLDLANKQISDLSPLSSLTNLYRVHLEDNQIKDLRPLSELTQLYSLYLTNNQVKNLQPLSKISGLGKLYLGNNQIEDLQPLSKLANSLALLVLNNNKISDPQPLAKLTVIDYIDLSGNQIRDIKSLEPLTRLLKYCALDLRDNPIRDSQIKSLKWDGLIKNCNHNNPLGR
jgi:internalin A